MRHNRIQPLLQYGCVALRMRFFPQNFRTIKRILPGSLSPSHREGPGTEVDHRLDLDIIIHQDVSCTVSSFAFCVSDFLADNELHMRYGTCFSGVALSQSTFTNAIL